MELRDINYIKSLLLMAFNETEFKNLEKEYLKAMEICRKEQNKIFKKLGI